MSGSRVRPSRRWLGAALTTFALTPPTLACATEAAKPDDASLQLERAPARFQLRSIQVLGNTVLSAADFDRAAQPWKGNLLGTLELAALSRALSAVYENNGYEGSSVTLVDQDIVDGQVVFQAREVIISDIEVSERNRWLKPAFTASAFASLRERPVHVPALRALLLRLRESGLYERLDAEVQLPAAGDNRARLTIDAESALPLQAQLNSANNRNPSIGHRRDEVALFHASLTGHGDPLELRLGRTAGLNDRQIRYEFPLPAQRLRLFANVVRSSSLAIEPASFRELDIRATSDSESAGATWFWKDSPEERLALLASIENRRSLTTLLGIPFSFTPGLPDDVARSRTAKLETQWSRRGSTGGLSARLGWLAGRIDNIEPIAGGVGIAPRFNVLQGGFEAAWRPSPQRIEWRLRSEWQTTRDNLLAADRLSLGGATTVRGYRENTTLRDKGVLVSLEGRLPAWSFGEKLKIVTGAFIDAGWSRNVRGGNDGGPEKLASAGLMLEAQWTQHLGIKLHWARAKDRLPGNDLQDRGLHFSVQLNAR